MGKVQIHWITFKKNKFYVRGWDIGEMAYQQDSIIYLVLSSYLRTCWEADYGS